MNFENVQEKVNLERRIRKHIHGKKQIFEVESPPGFSGVCERFAKAIVHRRWNLEDDEIKVSSEHGKVRIENAPFDLAHTLLLEGLPFTDVKIQIFRGRCSTIEKLHSVLEKIPWDIWVPAQRRLNWNIRVNSLKSRLYNESQLKIEMMEFLHRRFSHPTFQDTAEIACDVWIERESLEIFLSLGGRNYWQRGQKQTFQHAAPLREDIASCLVLRLRELSLEWHGTDRPTKVFNPFCGTGTLLHEAAILIADCGQLTSNCNNWSYPNLPFFKAASFEHERKKLAERLSLKHSSSAKVTFQAEDLEKDLCEATEQWFHAMNKSGYDCGEAVAHCKNSIDNDATWFCKTSENDMFWILANPPFGLRLSNAHQGGTEQLYARFADRIFKSVHRRGHENSPIASGVVLCPTEAIWQTVRTALKNWPQCCEHFTLGGLDMRAFYFSSPSVDGKRSFQVRKPKSL
jgi:23S rRNA G2445 N2-methylase RlmL